MSENIVLNIDCMEYMKTLSDKAFDLAIVDPPYGDPEKKVERTGGAWAAKYGKVIKEWDITPPRVYFDELFRVARYCIIWGGNYFDLPPTRNFIVWRKLSISETFTMAMAELAWTNIPGNAKVFDWVPQGSKDDPRFHPTQKPIALYQWLLQKYARSGDRILDTHVGSGSSRIACWELGFDFVGCEIDPVYWKLQEKRFKEYQEQPKLF